MKIEFTPGQDTLADVSLFVQDCFDRGIAITIIPQKQMLRIAGPSNGKKGKRAPDITRSIFLKIKAGDPSITSHYSKATVSRVLATANFAAYCIEKDKVASSRRKARAK